MAIDPGVRLVAAVSGDLIGHLPQSAGHLSVDAEVVYGKPDSYSVYGRTDLIVSVVP